MVIPDIVYRYYLYDSPKTYNADPRRISSPREIYLNDLHFLLQKVGSISQHNINFLLTIYIYETEDVISLVLNQKGEVNRANHNSFEEGRKKQAHINKAQIENAETLAELEKVEIKY